VPAAPRLVLEATGTYWVGAATALAEAGWPVNVVPPASDRAYPRARLRRALDMVALAAARSNSPLRAFYRRLPARGTRKKVALVAIARKLLVLLVTLLRRQRTYDPNWRTRPRRDA
jgi:transposase